MIRVNEVREGQADPTPMMKNIIVIPHEGGQPFEFVQKYKRAPMGLISSGDEFCARTDRALADIPGVFKLVDDILTHGETYGQLLERIKTHWVYLPFLKKIWRKRVK